MFEIGDDEKRTEAETEKKNAKDMRNKALETLTETRKRRISEDGADAEKSKKRGSNFSRIEKSGGAFGFDEVLSQKHPCLHSKKNVSHFLFSGGCFPSSSFLVRGARMRAWF